MTEIREWWAQGGHVELSGHRIWTRRWGTGPSMTLLHGFPSSSHDFAKIAPALAEHHELLTLDLLGFGATDKPADHDYSIHEQVDLVQQLWEHHGITSSVVVAHDYSVSVAQELLARDAPIERLHLMNGGLYPGMHRPQPAQYALLDPETGPKLSAAMNEELFVESLRPTFAEDYDHVEDARAIWASTAEGGVVLHRTIHYMTDRVENADRWTGALEETDVPLSFVWGMLDPVSGAHMAEHIRERLPDAPITALDDVSHWPLLEAPDRVAAAILDA
jgi:pimeloyl-ACP methyl ester carboxylesterase